MAVSPANGKPITPVAVQILLSLSQGDLHGYGIKLDIERRTDGGMKLGSGTLYEAIQRLERDGLIEHAMAGHKENGRKRQYYRLTGPGMGALRKELAELEAIVTFARENDVIPGTRPA